MTIKNKIYNWWHRVRRLNRKGCVNCGKFEDKIVKYDWSKKNFTFISLKYKFFRGN